MSPLTLRVKYGPGLKKGPGPTYRKLQKVGTWLKDPRGSICITILDLGTPKNHTKQGFGVPKSIIVLQMDPPGMVRAGIPFSIPFGVWG